MTAPTSQIAVSNICIARANAWLVKTSLLLLFSSVAAANGALGQAPATPVTEPALSFWARPQTQLFAHGEPVILVLSIYTRSSEPIFVSRLTADEFVELNVIAPDGKEVPWQDKGQLYPENTLPLISLYSGHIKRFLRKELFRAKTEQDLFSTSLVNILSPPNIR